MIEIKRIEDVPPSVASAIESLRRIILDDTDWLGAQITMDRLRVTPHAQWTLDIRCIEPDEEVQS